MASVRLLTAAKILNGSSALAASVWFLSARVSDNNLGKKILVVQRYRDGMRAHIHQLLLRRRTLCHLVSEKSVVKHLLRFSVYISIKYLITTPLILLVQF